MRNIVSFAHVRVKHCCIHFHATVALEVKFIISASILLLVVVCCRRLKIRSSCLTACCHIDAQRQHFFFICQPDISSLERMRMEWSSAQMHAPTHSCLHYIGVDSPATSDKKKQSIPCFGTLYNNRLERNKKNLQNVFQRHSKPE